MVFFNVCFLTHSNHYFYHSTGPPSILPQSRSHIPIHWSFVCKEPTNCQSLYLHYRARTTDPHGMTISNICGWNEMRLVCISPFPGRSSACSTGKAALIRHILLTVSRILPDLLDKSQKCSTLFGGARFFPEVLTSVCLAFSTLTCAPKT